MKLNDNAKCSWNTCWPFLDPADGERAAQMNNIPSGRDSKSRMLSKRGDDVFSPLGTAPDEFPFIAFLSAAYRATRPLSNSFTKASPPC
jgi:hypothetical protein